MSGARRSDGTYVWFSAIGKCTENLSGPPYVRTRLMAFFSYPEETDDIRQSELDFRKRVAIAQIGVCRGFMPLEYSTVEDGDRDGAWGNYKNHRNAALENYDLGSGDMVIDANP